MVPMISPYTPLAQITKALGTYSGCGATQKNTATVHFGSTMMEKLSTRERVRNSTTLQVKTLSPGKQLKKDQKNPNPALDKPATRMSE